MIMNHVHRMNRLLLLLYTIMAALPILYSCIWLFIICHHQQQTMHDMLSIVSQFPARL